METQELHRGRLIDHIQLVVRDIEASRRFYKAVFAVLGIPIGGDEKDYFWADELFVSTADSEAAAGKLTGRNHLAFQASDRAMVDAFHAAGLEGGGGQRQAGRTSLSSRLLRRVSARPGWQQHRGRVPRRGEPQRALGQDHVLRRFGRVTISARASGIS